jgi:hypothetical protein
LICVIDSRVYVMSKVVILLISILSFLILVYYYYYYVLQHLKNDNINLSTADAHIRHQHSYCDADRGAHYDIFLKMENRRLWNNKLLHFMNLQNDSFISPLFLKQVRPKADRLDILVKYYSPILLNIVKELYAKDISFFEYDTDVALLEEIIALRDAF